MVIDVIVIRGLKPVQVVEPVGKHQKRVSPRTHSQSNPQWFMTDYGSDTVSLVWLTKRANLFSN